MRVNLIRFRTTSSQLLGTNSLIDNSNNISLLNLVGNLSLFYPIRVLIGYEVFTLMSTLGLFQSLFKTLKPNKNE